MGTKKTLSIISIFCAFISSGCTTDYEDSNLSITDNDAWRYDENNYPTDTINLWGSKAAVRDMGDYYLFQGDIILNKCDSNLFLTPESRGLAITGRQWPNNKVYYSLSGIETKYISTFERAIHWIEMGSYIEMCPRYNEKDYIQFSIVSNLDDGVAGASDYLGRKGGVQNIFITPGSAYNTGTIVHEICHAIGMDHEMCRTDRDKYVKIDFEKINEKMRYQYKTFAEKGLSGINVGPFDFNSIMMYPSLGVMTKLNGDIIISQRDSLSTGDMKTLATLQPLGTDFAFFDPLGYNNNISESTWYQNSKILQCPEGARLDFKFKYINNVSNSKYNGFSKSDFNIYSIVSIVNRKTGDEIYKKNIPLQETSTYIEIPLSNINLTPGGYTTFLILTGSINGQETASKKKTLEGLLYSPVLYLHLDKAVINGINKNIPSEYGNSKRALTYISIE